MLGFLSLPLGWVSFTFSFHSMASHRLGLLLCLASACGGQAEVASASYIQVAAPDVSGECAISSFLSCHSKDLKRRTSVTVQLQLRVLFSKQKESTPLRHEGGLIPKERPQSILASSFYTFVSSPSCLPYANWASQEGCLFHRRFSLWSSGYLLFHFPGFFLCLLATTILDSFSLV